MAAQRFRDMQREINVVTELLQGRHRLLSECRDGLDLLIDTIREENEKLSSSLYRCMLGSTLLRIQKSVQHPYFKSAVVKIQRNQSNLLTAREEQEVEFLGSEEESQIDPQVRENLALWKSA